MITTLIPFISFRLCDLKSIRGKSIKDDSHKLKGSKAAKNARAKVAGLRDMSSEEENKMDSLDTDEETLVNQKTSKVCTMYAIKDY